MARTKGAKSTVGIKMSTLAENFRGDDILQVGVTFLKSRGFSLREKQELSKETEFLVEKKEESNNNFVIEKL